MNCKPKHKTLRAANGFGINPWVNPLEPQQSNSITQLTQNNAARQFANSAYSWADQDRANAQQATQFNQGLQRDQFGLQAGQQRFNQGLLRDQFDASRQDQALNNAYRARREQRQVMDFNRAQTAMSQPLQAMKPYRLRNGGEIHAAVGFGSEGYTDRWGTRWMSPRDGVEFENKQRLTELQIAEKEAQLGLGGMERPGMQPGLEQAGVPRRGLRMLSGGDLQTGTGGDVPGTGKGDKIDAKYEPGEFVVSNDMLDAEPELRDHLRTLREQVLAAKGMTVAEADAKAVGKGRGLRAEEGADGDALKQRRMRDFNLTAADYGAIEGGLQAKERRGENIRNALGKNDGFAKLATLNQQAANADAKVQADAARGIYRDVEPTASPELTQKIDDGRRSDLRGYVDAQSMRDPGGALPTVPKSLRDTGNIYKTVDALGRTTYSGGNVKEGAKFIGNDGNEFTPKGKVEYAKPGEPVGMFPGGGGVVFTPRSSDPAQRTEDIATAKANAAAFRAQQAAQDAEESRAYHEAGMAGNREIAKNQSLRDIDARVKSAQHVLSSRTATDGEKAAALKIVDDAGSMLQGVERSYAEGETNRARDAAQSATTIRAEELRSQADMARAQAPLRAAEAQRQRDAAIWAAAGGDPVKASQLAAQAGLDPKKYTDMVSTAQGQVKARNDIESSTQKLIRDRIAGTLPSSGDPKADEAFADRIANTIVTNNPEVTRYDPERLAKELPALRARATLLERFRNPQESGFESWLPDVISGRTAPNRMSQLPPPEFFKGAKIEEKASGLRGTMTPGGLEKGDFVLNLPGYKNMNMGKLDDTERAELEKMIAAANKKAG